ncbi:MAG: hypothetical protein JEZ11_07115 [Desulfobacterales bacterium]|nr:hypothetical protein [Desulfobacterales bacterium]
MATQTGKIARNQEKAIVALLSCPSVPSAAREAKVSQRTLYRWLDLGPFQRAYREARQKVVSHAVAAIQGAMSEATGTLRAVMKDSDAPASSRVAAARAVLDLGLRAVEIEDIEERVRAIENQIE